MPGHYEYEEESECGIITLIVIIVGFFIIGPFSLIFVCCPCDTKKTKKWVEDRSVPLMNQQSNPVVQSMRRDTEREARLERERRQREEREREARAKAVRDKEAAMGNAQRQAGRVAAIHIDGIKNAGWNGLYRQAGEHGGWPYYKNAAERYLFRSPAADPDCWYLRQTFSPSESVHSFAIFAKFGLIPMGEQVWRDGELVGDTFQPRTYSVKEVMHAEMADHDKVKCLKRFITTKTFHCNECNTNFPVDTLMYGCRLCDYDMCEPCKSANVLAATQTGKTVIIAATATEDGGTTGATASGGATPTLSEFLATIRLAEYEDSLVELGCASVHDLKEIEDDDAAELGMKKIEVKRMRREVEQLGLENFSF